MPEREHRLTKAPGLMATLRVIRSAAANTKQEERVDPGTETIRDRVRAGGKS